MKFRDMVFYSEDERDEMKSLSPAAFRTIMFGMFVLMLNFLAVIYISKSRYIYFWDSATYWDIAKEICDGGLTFQTLADSVNTMNYNYIAALIPAAVMSVFGTSRLVYVLSLVNCYLAPVLIMIYAISKKLGKAPEITFAVTVFLMPSLVFLTFNGFADVGGMFGALMCFYLYFDRDGKDAAIWKYFVIGGILVLTILWRRYFSFFAVSFITAMAADCILNRKKPTGIIITVLTSAAILLIFLRTFTVNILLADYGTLYSGYKMSVSTDLKLITRYFGFIYILLLAVSSTVFMIREKNIKPLFMWIQMIVCACMFMATQTHGQQHLLLYMPSLVMLNVYVIRKINKEWMLIAAVLLAVLHTANVLIPYSQPSNIREIKIYSPVPTFSMLPRYREDAYDILNLKLRLDKIVGEDETLGVLASSFEICEDALRNAEDSLGVKPTRDNYIVSLPQVDSRDLDLSEYGNVNYILTVNPPQTHLAEGEQTIIEEVLNDFNSWSGIATSYEEIYDFDTKIGDMEIKLYKRVRAVSEHELTALSKRIQKNS